MVSAALLPVVSCGQPVRRIETAPAREEVYELKQPFSVVEGLRPALKRLDAERRWNEAVFVIAVAQGVETAAESVHAAEQRAQVTSSPDRGSAVSTSLEPCGGDLPPCYVKARESGGSYTAYNPNGCGGYSCYGAWQFSGAWAGKLGLPLDLSTATPAQQDEAARRLWANGAGCSNWGACA